MELNFDEIESIGEYTPVPEGTYRCRVADVKEAQTSRGYPMWRLRLEIEEGEHAGRAIFDRLVFSPAALRRVKRVCQCLGLDTTGRQDLTPDMLVGRLCQVHAVVEDYIDQDGEARSSNTIPFDGYAPVSDDGTPF